MLGVIIGYSDMLIDEATRPILCVGQLAYLQSRRPGCLFGAASPRRSPARSLPNSESSTSNTVVTDLEGGAPPPDSRGDRTPYPLSPRRSGKSNSIRAKSSRSSSTAAVNARDAMPQGGKRIPGDLQRGFERSLRPALPAARALSSTVRRAIAETGVRDRAPRRKPTFLSRSSPPSRGATARALALPTVFGVVKQNNGLRVGLQRAWRGMGATFKVYLPVGTSPTIFRPAPG